MVKFEIWSAIGELEHYICVYYASVVGKFTVQFAIRVGYISEGMRTN